MQHFRSAISIAVQVYIHTNTLLITACQVVPTDPLPVLR